MSWHEKTVIRILLLVARIVAAGIKNFNPELATEIRTLATHISVVTTEADA